MEDIKVGEYVRLEGGYIRKYIKRSLDNHIILDKAVQGFNYLTSVEEKEKIIKHSSNLIDLIEVGDILEILCNEISKETNTIRIKDIEQLKVIKQIPKFIKSVTTKEQFASVSYEV